MRHLHLHAVYLLSFSVSVLSKLDYIDLWFIAGCMAVAPCASCVALVALLLLRGHAALFLLLLGRKTLADA